MSETNEIMAPIKLLLESQIEPLIPSCSTIDIADSNAKDYYIDFSFQVVTILLLQSNLDISNSDISNSAKFEASI